MRVLVIEDDVKVADALHEGLAAEGYDVAVARTGHEGAIRGMNEAFDVILLDLTLPGQDGLEVLTTLRRRGIQTRILVLTARDRIEDRVSGLDGGADDYLVKPFAFPELLARIRALLRGGGSQPYRFTVDDLTVDLLSQAAERSGERLDLSVREFQVLAYLMQHRRQVVSRESLARDVWNERDRSATLDNVIDAYIGRLRSKVDADRPVRLIHTIRGVGFMLDTQVP
jgi:DNA-binding response OmpR family regulator